MLITGIREFLVPGGMAEAGACRIRLREFTAPGCQAVEIMGESAGSTRMVTLIRCPTVSENNEHVSYPS